jgi:hypothetical protein
LFEGDASDKANTREKITNGNYFNHPNLHSFIDARHTLSFYCMEHFKSSAKRITKKFARNFAMSFLTWPMHPKDDEVYPVGTVVKGLKLRRERKLNLLNLPTRLF